MQRQKALGVMGRLLQRGPVLYLAITKLLLRYYPLTVLSCSTCAFVDFKHAALVNMPL